jgi:ribonuclease-3
MPEEPFEKLDELEAAIGYRFSERALMERALTHRSYAHEKSREPVAHNEALEFLGDAVLGFLVSDWLLEHFPTLPEGKLSKFKAYLVSADNLKVHAERLNLGEYLRLNRGEEKTGGRSKRTLLVDAYEALMAAIYLDGGIEAARRFLRQQFAEVMNMLNPEETEAMDYKTALQERLQAKGLPPPVYEVIDESGPAHDRTFHVKLTANSQVLAFGRGRTIKAAHQGAARLALQKLDRAARRTKRTKKNVIRRHREPSEPKEKQLHDD